MPNKIYRPSLAVRKLETGARRDEKHREIFFPKASSHSLSWNVHVSAKARDTLKNSLYNYTLEEFDVQF